MTKTKMKKKKPAIELTNSPYNQGFHDGTKHGMNLARKVLALEFLQRLKELENVKGIGPKTFERVIEMLDVSVPLEEKK